MQQKSDQTQHNNDSLIEKTILIVEDDDSIGEMLVEALSLETPYKTIRVSNGMEVLQVLHHLRPSLFITDYRLPLMNGLELYDRLHLTAASADIPTIIMSAYLPEEEIKKRHLVSLSKPFDLDDFLETVDRVLNHEYRAAC